MSPFTSVLSCLLIILADVHGHLRGKRRAQDSVLCRLTVVDLMFSFDDGDHSLRHDEQISCIPVVDGLEDDDMHPVALPKALHTENANAIRQGRLFVSISGASLENDGLQLSDSAEFEVLHRLPGHLRFLEQRHLGVVGTFSVAVVRISTTDSTPMFSRYALSDGMFGSGINLKTQYNACSFGQLQWELAPVGVIDVKVNQPISDFGSGSALVTAAQMQIKEDMNLKPFLVRNNQTSISHLADKVLMCLPPGTGNWAASAGINHWRAQFNDEWCLSLTATLHEIGE